LKILINRLNKKRATMQNFRVKINEVDSLLTEKTGLKYDLALTGKHNSEVEFKSKTNEGIDVLLKVGRTEFDKGGPVNWKYCADPSTDYWVHKNSTDLVSMTQDFYHILKNKMFDPTYLKTLTKKEDE
jgi:hypothetical protein